MLSLSQPATSNALARLRTFFDDELFVRSPRGLHPTRKAQRIVPALLTQLQVLEETVVSVEGFEPASSSVRWRLSLFDAWWPGEAGDEVKVDRKSVV